MSDQTKTETVAPAQQPKPKSLALQIEESKGQAQALLAASSVQEELAKIAIADQDVKRICNQLLRQCMRQPMEFVEVMRTPKGRHSVLDCAVFASLIGLPFDNAHLYPVPFLKSYKEGGVYKKAKIFQPVVGYPGWISIMHEQPEVASVDAQLVHANDKFSLNLANPDKMIHSPPAGGADRGECVGGYLICHLVKGGRPIVYYMTKGELDACFIETSDAWKKHPDAMKRAVLFRRGRKQVPRRPGSRLLVLDQAQNAVEAGAMQEVTGAILSRVSSSDVTVDSGDDSDAIEPEVMPA